MILMLYAKQRILCHHFDGRKSLTSIKKLLERDGVNVSRKTVWKFVHNFLETRFISHKEGSGHPTKITKVVKQLVETQMEKDDETTAYQLHKMLTDNGLFAVNFYYTEVSTSVGLDVSRCAVA